MGNFDADDDGEVVIIRLGELFILNHDGSPVAGIPLPIRVPGAPGRRVAPTYSPAAYVPSVALYDEDGDLLAAGADSLRRCAGPAGVRLAGNAVMSEGVQVVVHTAGANESGPPTVADFDGDGFAEVGTASSTAYVVFDFQCTGDPLPAECEREWVRWMVENDDCSSRATGSSVFDFEGDGSAEVVYADENTFRIFNGSDGTILYEDTTHSSNTRLEMPIVVDVDNDGKSEVVIPEPNYRSGVWRNRDLGRRRQQLGSHPAHLEPARLQRDQRDRGRSDSTRPADRTGRARGSTTSGRTFSRGVCLMRRTSSCARFRGSIATRASSRWRWSSATTAR